MKTLKREKIYANRYEDIGHMRVNIEEFIKQYVRAFNGLAVGRTDICW
jgi:hypothetical protein